MIDPASVHVSRRARRAKTDRLDAEALVRVLMAYARGERKVCSMVRVPTADEEDAKRQHRERERLIAARTAHVNRIKGLLATQGVMLTNPLRPDWPELLKKMHTGDGRPLPPRLMAELGREWQRLQLVIEMIGTVDSEREHARADNENAAVVGKKIELLRKLRGVGPIFATVLAREVFYRDFTNRREVGSYVGLAPTPFNSGESRRDQGVNKAGNPRARTTAIELAWLWLRHQPESWVVSMVPRAGRHTAGSDTENHDRRRRAKTDRRALAIPPDRHDPGWSRSQGLTEGRFPISGTGA